MKPDINSADSDKLASVSMQDVRVIINQNMKYRIVLIILYLSKDK